LAEMSARNLPLEEVLGFPEPVFMASPPFCERCTSDAERYAAGRTATTVGLLALSRRGLNQCRRRGSSHYATQ